MRYSHGTNVGGFYWQASAAGTVIGALIGAITGLVVAVIWRLDSGAILASIPAGLLIGSLLGFAGGFTGTIVVTRTGRLPGRVETILISLGEALLVGLLLNLVFSIPVVAWMLTIAPGCVLFGLLLFRASEELRTRGAAPAGPDDGL